MGGVRSSSAGIGHGVGETAGSAGGPEPDLASDRGIREAWRRHAGELFGFANRALGDHAAADEAVQETFLRAWRSAASYDRTRPLRPWLFTILRNVVADEARRRRRHPVLPPRASGLDPSEVDVARSQRSEYEHVDRVLDEWLLKEALLRIRDDHRVILVETYFRDRPYAAVAHDLGIPEGTARTRAFYALRALRLALEEMGWSR